MPQPLSSQQLMFQGEVIKIIDGGGTKMMKINLQPCTIDLTMSMSEELHLGDPVTMEARVMITRVEPAVFID